MRIPRLYTPQAFIQDTELSITGQTAHHVKHVLRLSNGATVQVFNGSGREYLALIKTIKRAEINLKITEAVPVQPEPTLDITLLQGIARNDRMDLILQKAVELGANAIQPLWTQHSQTHPKGNRMEKRFKHWQGVIISACEQCGRATIPQLAAAKNYSDWMGNTDTRGLRLLLQPGSETGLGTLNPSGERIYVLVGPEGGFDADEQVLARSAGFIGIDLGPRILRTETAAMAVLAGMQTLWGDFI